MRRFLATLVLATLVSSAGPAFGATRVIVALGDSLTAGLGVSPDEAYPALLEALEACEFKSLLQEVRDEASKAGTARQSELLL